MNILFITAHPYLPQMYGGLQTSTDALCRALIKRGHRVAVLGALMPDGWLGFSARLKIKLRQLTGRPRVARDTACGYPVWRAWFPWEAVSAVAAQEKPEIIVVLAVQPVRMALAAKPCGVPVLLQLQDVEFSQHGGEFRDLGPLPAVANSEFTAQTYREAYGLDPAVIYPTVNAARCRAQTSRENVTFVNPHAHKGLPIALEVAKRCPDIPFTFVETWPLKPQERAELGEALATLPNVTLLPPQDDMRAVYGTCKILLAPSLWNEGYGKVVTEAQLSGIPAIASRRGGLVEATGPGGILVDPEGPIDDWVAALRRLWDDPGYYAQTAAAALAHGARPAVTTAYQIDAWEKLLASVAQGKR